MKKSLCNRRSFLATSVLAGTTLAGPGILIQWLESPEASARVFAILKQHLGLSEGQRPLVDEFTRSLQNSARHHLSAPAFQAKLKADENELSLYLVQEFMVTSNYLAYHNGFEKELRMLPDSSRMKGSRGVSSGLFS